MTTYLIGPSRSTRDHAQRERLDPRTTVHVHDAQVLRGRRIHPVDEVRWINPSALTMRQWETIEAAIRSASLGQRRC